MRMTQQRRAILSALECAQHPLDPKEILLAAGKKVHGLSLTTVYRSLKVLVETGAAVGVDVLGQAPRYELSGLAHHHHFLCESCNRLYDVPGCPGRSLDRLAPTGFTVSRHELLLTGLCASCN